MRRLWRFIRHFSIHCDPILACSLHGRCWVHSPWEYDQAGDE